MERQLMTAQIMVSYEVLNGASLMEAARDVHEARLPPEEATSPKAYERMIALVAGSVEAAARSLLQAQLSEKSLPGCALLQSSVAVVLDGDLDAVDD